MTNRPSVIKAPAEISSSLLDAATFRHTTCSRLVQAGFPLIVVQKWMGHATIQTTMKYAHLAPDSLDVALQALNERKAA